MFVFLFFVLFYIQRELSSGLLAKMSKLVRTGRMHVCKFDAVFAISLTSNSASGQEAGMSLLTVLCYTWEAELSVGMKAGCCDREQWRTKKGTASQSQEGIG